MQGQCGSFRCARRAHHKGWELWDVWEIGERHLSCFDFGCRADSAVLIGGPDTRSSHRYTVHSGCCTHTSESPDHRPCMLPLNAGCGSCSDLPFIDLQDFPWLHTTTRLVASLVSRRACVNHSPPTKLRHGTPPYAAQDMPMQPTSTSPHQGRPCSWKWCRSVVALSLQRQGEGSDTRCSRGGFSPPTPLAGVASWR
jgi:hypothetical protein